MPKFKKNEIIAENNNAVSNDKTNYDTMIALMTPQNNFDGYENAVLGVNSFDDPLHLLNRSIAPVIPLTQAQRDEVYRKNGIEALIIDIVPEDCVKKELCIESKSDDEESEKAIQDYLNGMNTIINPQTNETVNFYQVFAQADKLSRLHDCAFVIFDFDDNLDWFEPVQIEKIKGISAVHICDRWQVNYQDYQAYKVNDFILAMVGNEYIKIHMSRVLVFDGIDRGQRIRTKNSGFGEGIMTGDFLDACETLSNTYNQLYSSLKDAKIDVLGFKGLFEMIRKKNETEVFKKLSLMKSSLNRYKMLVTDSEDTFKREFANITAMMDSLESAKERVCTLARIPATRLYGSNPQASIGGQSGLSQLLDYYDKIKVRQFTKYYPKWHKIIPIICNLLKINPDDITFKFKPLFELSELEEAEKHLKEQQQKKLESEMYSTYINDQVITPEEVYDLVFAEKQTTNTETRKIMNKVSKQTKVKSDMK